MYYILVPQKLISERQVFTDNEQLPEPDGRTVVPVSDLRFTQFSYGQVELINASDLALLRDALTPSASASSTDKK